MYVRGVEQILVDMMAQPDLASAVFRRIADFYVEYARRTLQAGEGNIDIFFTGDDFGTQENLFVPPALWRQLLGDGFKRLVDVGHAFGCRVAHHTCGCVTPLLPDLIDCGLDILNPLQPEVTGMDHTEIKRRFGDRLTFHGGISIQKTMPYGTPADIREEVRNCKRSLGPGGGYVLCTAHNIQPDTPLKNIEALFDAYREMGRYE
jgi:uroporphyrinogen decarboxylase